MLSPWHAEPPRIGVPVKSTSAIFASALVIGLSGAIMPGPLLTASIGYTIERGFVAGGPLLVLGHALLELALVALVLAGLGPLPASPVLAGVLISLANPYWSLWWATIGLKYIALSRESGKAGVAAFYCGHQLSDVGWYFFVAGAVALGRKAVSDAAYRWVIGLCGGVMLGFGVYFIVGAALALAQARKAAAPVPGEH